MSEIISEPEIIESKNEPSTVKTEVKSNVVIDSKPVETSKTDNNVVIEKDYQLEKATATTEKPKANDTKTTEKSKPTTKNTSNNTSLGLILILAIVLSGLIGMAGGYAGYKIASKDNDSSSSSSVSNTNTITKVNTVQEESAITELAKNNMPSVVSVIVSKDLPVYEKSINDDGGLFDFFSSSKRNQIGSKQQQIGAGSGFIASKDGFIVTNRHVVSDNTADYTVILNDGTKLPAKVLARDSVLDIAVVKVEAKGDLKPVSFGNSDNLVVGQTTIAIGNSLGQFSNTVSKGIISGLARSITAGGDNVAPEKLDNIIQTDASINPGNSGGPLLDINGNVIGVNVAKAESGENIGFAIPITSVKKVLESVIKNGKIVRPYLGIRYQMITADFAKENNLSVNYGALIYSNRNTDGPAIVAGSPAAKAGLKLGDIILQVNNQKVDENNDLKTVIQKFSTGDTLNLKIQRGDQQIEVKIVLENQPES